MIWHQLMKYFFGLDNELTDNNYSVSVIDINTKDTKLDKAKIPDVQYYGIGKGKVMGYQGVQVVTVYDVIHLWIRAASLLPQTSQRAREDKMLRQLWYLSK